jgi:hypothetical protein
MKLSRSTTRTVTITLALLLALLAALLLMSGRASSAPPTWAPAGSAAITPGVQMYTQGAQCTANFVYTDSAGKVYVGYAAHCAGLGEATDTDGCRADSLPLGTRVTFNRGGSLLDEGTVVGAGTLVYSSWVRMRELGTTDPNVCAYNDLALVEVDAADAGKVNPSVPFWGGPTGIDTDGTRAGDRVYTYGNSSLRGGLGTLSPHTGVSLGDAVADADGWSHPLYTLTPGVPGDSGSGFLSDGGLAVGVLSTLGLAPLPVSNNIGDLAQELAWAQQHSGIDGLELALGTEPFRSVL